MSLLFMDSFDHYDTASGAQKYTSFAGTIVTGRHGNAIDTPGCVMGLPVTSPRSIMGCAIKFNTFTAQTLIVYDSVFNLDRIIITANNDGSLTISGEVSLNFGTTVPNVVTIGDLYYYIELDVLLHETAGEINVWVNDDDVFSVSGIPTISPGFPSSTYLWSGIRLGRGNPDIVCDDFYVLDGTDDGQRTADGHDFASRFGDVEIDVIRPNGDGETVEWTPYPTSPNWSNVNDQYPNGDTNYNYTGTTGAIDLLEMEDVGIQDAIIGAQMLISAKKATAGSAQLAGLMGQDGTTYQQATASPTTSYAYRNRDIFMTSPSGASWTASILNAIKAGYKRIT